MTEEWRPCVQVPHTEVSSMGRVRTVARSQAVVHPTKGKFVAHYKAKMKAINPGKDGYLIVSFPKSFPKTSVSVHRLVAAAFIPNPDNKPQVNHINGDITDNRVENLEWATASENAQHAYKILGRQSNFRHLVGFKNANAIPITYQGETKTLIEWARVKAIPRSTMYNRKFNGWSVEDMIEVPVGGRRTRLRLSQ